MSHSLSFVRRQASPHPAPPRPAPSAATRARRPTPDGLRIPRDAGRGLGTRPQLPAWGAPTGQCARDPAPARRPRGRSRRCPRRRRRPTRCSLGKRERTCPPGRGEADNGASGEGSGAGTHGLQVTLAVGTLNGSRSGDPGSLAGQGDTPQPPGDPAPLHFLESLGQKAGRPRLGRGKPCCSGGTGCSRLGCCEAGFGGEAAGGAPLQSLALAAVMSNLKPLQAAWLGQLRGTCLFLFKNRGNSI